MKRRILPTVGAAGVAGAAAYVLIIRPCHVRWGATDWEVTELLLGDEFVPRPRLQATHAITIDATARDVWPWVVQIGQGRGGFYTWLENLVGCRMRNADRVLRQGAAGEHHGLRGGPGPGHRGVLGIRPERTRPEHDTPDRPRPRRLQARLQGLPRLARRIGARTFHHEAEDDADDQAAGRTRGRRRGGRAPSEVRAASEEPAAAAPPAARIFLVGQR